MREVSAQYDHERESSLKTSRQLKILFRSSRFLRLDPASPGSSLNASPSSGEATPFGRLHRHYRRMIDVSLHSLAAAPLRLATLYRNRLVFHFHLSSCFRSCHVFRPYYLSLMSIQKFLQETRPRTTSTELRDSVSLPELIRILYRCSCEQTAVFTTFTVRNVHAP